MYKETIAEKFVEGSKTDQDQKNISRTGRTSVSIVVPVLNEMEVLPFFWERLCTVIKQMAQTSDCQISATIREVIFVDGGSTDGTLSFLENLSSKLIDGIDVCSVKILHQPVRTKLAYGEFLGITSASGDLVIKMDGDLQHDPFFIPDMIRNSTEDHIVIASRYISNGGNSWSPMRGIISRFARFEAHAFLPGTRGVGDPISGFFLIHRESIKSKQPHKDGYKLLMHILALKNRTTTIKEIPYLMNERNRGNSKIVNSISKTIINFNKELIFTKRASLGVSNGEGKVTHNKPRLLIVSRSSFEGGKEGGADRYAITLTKELQRVTNGEVELYFVGRKNDGLQQTVSKLIEVKNKRSIESTNSLKYFFNGFLLNVSSTITAINFLQKNKDITGINTNSNIATILIKLVTLGRKMEVIYTIHDSLYSSMEQMKWWETPIRLLNNFILERIAIKVSSKIIAVSPVIENQIPIRHKSKVNLIFPQGNLPLIELNSTSAMDRFTPFPTKYALVAGYLDDRKRVDIILRSWRFVAKEISLIVVGGGPNYNELRLLSLKMGISDRVFFTGRIDDNELSYLMRNSLFGVVASHREGFPTFIIECLKSGIPAIFFISNGENIYGKVAGDYLVVKKLVEPRQVSNDINQFITRILSTNNEIIKQWGLRAFRLKDEVISTLFAVPLLHYDEGLNTPR